MIYPDGHAEWLQTDNPNAPVPPFKGRMWLIISDPDENETFLLRILDQWGKRLEERKLQRLSLYLYVFK